jgi:hypothetical protein
MAGLTTNAAVIAPAKIVRKLLRIVPFSPLD